MILCRVVFPLAFIMQHTFTNAREPIRGEEGEKIEGSHHNYQDSNHSMDTITSYLRGDTKYSTMSNIRSEMSDRNLGAEEKCNISSGTFFIQSVSSGNNIYIDERVRVMGPNIGVKDNVYIRSLGNNEYAIQSAWLESYVRVPKSGNFHTVNTQTYVGSYERFYITCFDNGDVAFKSKKHGNYLRENGVEIMTYKSSVSSIMDNMKWRLITEGVHEPSPKPEKTYYIKSVYGTYISMNNKNKVKFMKHNKSYERITIRSTCHFLDCDRIAIKSATHGERYLRVSGTGGGRTVGAQTYMGDYEMFYMETRSNGKVAFKSFKHDNYLHANKDKKKLDTSSGANANDSLFTLVPV